MEIPNDSFLEYLWKGLEWLGSALLAVAIFMFKGYREEFATLKKDNGELKEAFIEQKNANLILMQTVTHIDNNLKQWDNGSRKMLHDLMTLEKNYELLKLEVSHLKGSK